MKRWSRRTYWLVTGFLKKYKKIIAGSVLASILLVGVVFLIKPLLPRMKGKQYIGVVGRFRLTEIPEEVEQNLGLGLTQIGENGKPQPGVARKWEILEDGKVYRFYIDQEAEWSDSSKVKLEDLNFEIGDVEVKKEEPNILQFTLPEPFAPFPSILSKPLIKNGLLTTGKFTIKDIKTEGAYLRQVWLESGNERRIYRFYDTLNQAVAAFKLGEIDVLSSLFESTELSEWPNTRLEEAVRDDYYVGVFFNLESAALGGDGGKSVRQALAYAIKDKVNMSQRALSPIDPNSWAYNPGVKKYQYDKSRAIELLEQLSGQNSVAVELATIPELLGLAEKIKSDWQAIGVETEIRVVASRPSNFQAFLGIERIDSDPDQYHLWHSTQASNIVNMHNPRIDKLLEDGRQTIDQEERAQIYIDFQRFLVEEAPAVFLYHPKSYLIKRD